ncbi:response regulator transcription factor [Nocardiopsis exhalans]|uniref:DNA-binding NarL/FixJ family response regulator n=2 Tax=Nocardiopsis TaxID=2013 RepID=A0A840WV94_9ACTN|nr:MULTISPECIES: response regulator transcription factor [Nocardiopsis]MBB5494068.1 DNA-binding NarL/FixJ family response regulator [Nocardiopsis metallicus]USY20334.1 response regulator transcription factor [Nocardiopsis exhalans]
MTGGGAEGARKQIRVFLVDDHEVVRRGVAALLETEDDMTVVGEAGTAEQALSRIPVVLPDVAVLDVRLPGGSGVQVCREIRSDHPEIACLMLTSFADEDALYDAVMAGAAGYVLKQIHGADLVGAVRTVAAGGSLLDSGSTGAMLERLRGAQAEPDPLAELTPQERQILDLIGEGMTNRQIGERLYLAEKTVKNYVSALLAKLDLKRRTQAAVLVAELRGRRY